MSGLSYYTDEELVALAQKILAKYNKALADAKAIAVEYGFDIAESENRILNIIFTKLKDKRDAVTKKSVEPAYLKALLALAKEGNFTTLADVVNLFENQKYAELKSLLLSLNLFSEGHKSNRVKEGKVEKSAPKLLKIHFPDGLVIFNDKASVTFAEVIEYIGIEKVERLGIRVSGQPLISKEPCRQQQKQVGEWFITTHSSTETKKNILENLSNTFQLDLIVEII